MGGRREVRLAGGRSLAISLGLSALAAIPAAAQARATITVAATVVDLSQAQANLQATTNLAVRTAAAPTGTTAPSRRDTGTASILLSYAEGGVPDAPSDPLLATIIYW
jgi:hypothetical protein